MHDNSSLTTEEPIFSEFSDDPDFAELLEMFAETIDEKRQSFQQAFQEHDLDQLKTHAHQLKGSGAGYGFEGLSNIASRLEDACKENNIDEVGKTLDEVLIYMNRIQI